MPDIHSCIHALGIVPVVTLDDASHAVPLARALLAGGLSVAEITLRTDAATESIRRIRADAPDMLVGAGTVTSIAKAREALGAGAKFIVTPGFTPDVVSWCLENAVPVFPGCVTASEIEGAMNLGLAVVKFFPAEQSGGLAAIRALSAPYHGMRFMPTGGIDARNMAGYLGFPGVFACGGSFMAPVDAVRDGRWNDITALSREAVSAAQGFVLEHVELYTENAPEAAAVGEWFSSVTGHLVHPECETPLVAPGLRITGASPCGLVAGLHYGVVNVERSCRRLERMGYTLIPDTVRRDRNGQRVAAALADAGHGFAIHLSNRRNM